MLEVEKVDNLGVVGKDNFIIKTSHYTSYTPTYLGNGNLGLQTTVKGIDVADSFVAGLFSHEKDDVSRIAGIPYWNWFDIRTGGKWLSGVSLSENNLKDYQQSLDLKRALFSTSYKWRSLGIESQTFIARHLPYLGCQKLEIEVFKSADFTVAFGILEANRGNNYRLKIDPRVEFSLMNRGESIWRPGKCSLYDLRTDTVDNQVHFGAKARPEGIDREIRMDVLVFANHEIGGKARKINGKVEIDYQPETHERFCFYKYFFLDQINIYTPESYEKVLDEHTKAWEKIYDTRIILEGDDETQKLINACQYGIFSSVREEMNVSISPMGLSNSGYFGHYFHDSEIWFLPVFLLMAPKIAARLLEFRYKTLDRAREKAQKHGYKGAMFAWEADENGGEETPRFAWQNAEREIHINGAIAWGVWHYYLITKDRGWLKKYGWKLLSEISEFWMSRAIYNKELDRYEIKNVVSIDEHSIGVDNDSYTNAICKKSLEYTFQAAKDLGKRINPKWQEIAKKIHIPYDPKNRAFVEYDQAPSYHNHIGHTLSILSYPLDLKMGKEVKRNTLANALASAEQTPYLVGMMPTFYPIVACELRDKQLVKKLMRSIYANYVSLPYFSFTEIKGSDAINFLTSAAGFLQIFLFGFSGLRITEKGLEQKYKSMLLPEWKRIVLRNINVGGKKKTVISTTPLG